MACLLGWWGWRGKGEQLLYTFIAKHAVCFCGRWEIFENQFAKGRRRTGSTVQAAKLLVVQRPRDFEASEAVRQRSTGWEVLTVSVAVGESLLPDGCIKAKAFRTSQVAYAGEPDQRRLRQGFQVQFFTDRSPSAQTEAKLTPTANLDPHL